MEEQFKGSERSPQKDKALDLANADAVCAESFEGDTMLVMVESLQPSSNDNNDLFPSFQLIGDTSSTYSIPNSADHADGSPTAIAADDLEILDGSTMLDSYEPHEDDMLLSSLNTCSSNISLSSDELSVHMENSDKWSWPVESNYPGWKVDQNLLDVEKEGYVPYDIDRGRKIQLQSKSAFITDEVKRTQESVKKYADNKAQYYRAFADLNRPAVANMPTKYGFQRSHSSNDLSGRLDSSDNSDGPENMFEKEGRKYSRGHASKNLVSERRRRKKLNERLYSLRALVPKISKMDKASIVGDAISYVRDLQQEVEQMQEDIAMLEASKDVVTGGGMDRSKRLRRENAARSSSRVITEHRLVELEVSQMEDKTYHLRILCKKSPGVMVQLTRALEALEFQILNANLTTVNDHILNTLVVEMKNLPPMKPEELRKMTLEIIPRFGIFL